MNGDFSITPSGIYEAAGTVLDYKRIDTQTPVNSQKKVDGVTEWITAIGPTTEPLHLMVINIHCFFVLSRDLHAYYSALGSHPTPSQSGNQVRVLIANQHKPELRIRGGR